MIMKLMTHYPVIWHYTVEVHAHGIQHNITVLPLYLKNTILKISVANLAKLCNQICSGEIVKKGTSCNFFNACGKWVVNVEQNFRGTKKPPFDFPF